MKLTNLLIKKSIETEAEDLNIKIDIIVKDTIKLINIYSEIKGSGKGTKMMRFIIDYANKSKKNIVLDVDIENSQSRLISFYKRLGFTLDTTHYEKDEDTGDYLLSYKAMMSGNFYPLMTYKHK